MVYFSKPVEARHEILTANNNTPYAVTVLDTRGGPVVLDVPPASGKVMLFGSGIDSWQVPLVDVGPTGEDAGKGGKYLFLPPGYTDTPPDGYIVTPSPTYFLHFGLRPIMSEDATFEDVAAYNKTLKIYPLAEATDPQTKYVDGYPQPWTTLPVYDVTFFRDLAQVVNDEPLQQKDAVMLGLLASIGIEKGKPFNPTGDAAKLFDEAARDAYEMQNYFVTPGKGYALIWPDRQWGGFNLTQQEGFTFVEDGKLLVDERSGGFMFWATFLPKKLGPASAYPIGIRDGAGRLLSGQKSYRLHVPNDVPVRDFWSVIVYSMKTKSMIPNALDRAGLSSYDKSKLQVDADGSVDIHFGPNAPAGMESNWIPTGESFFLLFRLYGPEEAFVNRTWKLPDIEEMK